ncbi:hypothetical protein CGJ21_04840 [Vibrio parahaemolyticus]|uniref:sulfotransferase n=2 Tax=Vibrio parahaemolyticus TaxID=670 RepID=UPI00111EEF46|nr:sulfotransferase [Vibrio parahaemolyticus]TOF41920.1 hypothetical protein CGJ23_01115 [Vibrio parahaemolyticus]TOF50432.1 hypothetical protein CGJ21_04840 [Vibrio parahaemolyticus]
MSSFNRFKHQLDSALDLLENSEQIKQLDLPQVLGAQMVDTESLLSRCTHICDKHKQKKPTIRIIHHLACSGGTLISKCISAMPNVYLLSEVHPFTDLAKGRGKPKYAPSDISLLAKYAGIPKQKDLAARIFKNSIDDVYQHVESMGGILVLRDHTHADFNTDQSIPKKSSIVELLEEDYNVKSVLTIRNPIDSYASLFKNGWVHFKPQTFDEYCRRLLLLLDKFEGARVFKYEDFVDSPSLVMNEICDEFKIPFNNDFEMIFDYFSVTGDSGRSGAEISKRSRRSTSKEMTEQVQLSEFYAIIKSRYFNDGL